MPQPDSGSVAHVARRKPDDVQRIVPAHHLSRLTWPPLRSDFMAVACLTICGYCLVTTTWPVIAGGALIAAVFCGVSPRMTGRFGLKTGADTSLGGEFADPFEDAMPAALEEPKPRQESPPRTGSGED